ncbi:hypothetical protein KY487_25170, partial [Ralstonia pseudosolanacearum]|uniref:hypothetical protein n=1 Tax=Ralstonia pseudosolanacearum TaxID=1310165 RepID=UPI001C8CE5F5
MTDFAAAFNRGQEAAALAAEARREIDEIFNTASRQLLDVTGGKLELGRFDFKKSPKAAFATPGVMRSLESFFGQVSHEIEPWIAARNPMAADQDWVKLAKWDQPQGGFPCVLSYDKRDVRCHNQEALAEAIAELLASPWAGERL